MPDGAWRNIFYTALVEGCDASEVEDTLAAAYSGPEIAALSATCRRQRALDGHHTGVAPWDDSIWYYDSASPYASR